MTKLHIGIGALLAGILVLTLSAQDRSPGSANPTVVVGTFDSRAVAIAYVRSAAFGEFVQEKKAEVDRDLERARAAGDDERVAELEAFGPAMQMRIHRQGFGAAPIDDIMILIKDELPGIAEEAGVDVIVSKWVVAYQRPDAKVVDVTDRLAAAFDPDEQTLEVIRDIVRSEPVPLDQLTDDH